MSHCCGHLSLLMQSNHHTFRLKLFNALQDTPITLETRLISRVNYPQYVNHTYTSKNYNSAIEQFLQNEFSCSSWSFPLYALPQAKIRKYKRRARSTQEGQTKEVSYIIICRCRAVRLKTQRRSSDCFGAIYHLIIYVIIFLLLPVAIQQCSRQSLLASYQSYCNKNYLNLVGYIYILP